jgi:hypothetical protein
VLLEIRVVSRKTPADGKLEITLHTARRLQRLREPLRVRVGDERGDGRVAAMTCTCAKGDGAAHEHHFLSSELFRELTPDETVVLELGDNDEILVARPHPL